MCEGDLGQLCECCCCLCDSDCDCLDCCCDCDGDCLDFCCGNANCIRGGGMHSSTPCWDSICDCICPDEDSKKRKKKKNKEHEVVTTQPGRVTTDL